MRSFFQVSLIYFEIFKTKVNFVLTNPVRFKKVKV